MIKFYNVYETVLQRGPGTFEVLIFKSTINVDLKLNLALGTSFILAIILKHIEQTVNVTIRHDHIEFS